jgi:hypothetical protein
MYREDILSVNDISSKFTRTSEGFLSGRAIVTSVGVFEYPDGKGGIRKELRLPEEVFSQKSLDSLKLKPVTNEHPPEMLNSENAKTFTIGYMGNNPSIPDGWSSIPNMEKTDGYHVANDMLIFDKDAIDEIEQGKRALSCGYDCDLEKASPKARWCGQSYDFIQRDILYNHTSIVPAGRAGDNARIRMDSLNTTIDVTPKPDHVDSKDTKTNKEKAMDGLRTIVLDSVEYKAEDKVIDALASAKKEVEDTKTRLDSLTSEKEKVEAERDGYKASMDAMKVELETVKTDTSKMDAMVTERIALMETAKKVGFEIKAGMDAPAIKKGCIATKFPTFDFASKSDAYVQARFDILLETLDSDADASVRSVNTDSAPAVEDTIAKKKKEYAERLANAYKNKGGK